MSKEEADHTTPRHAVSSKGMALTLLYHRVVPIPICQHQSKKVTGSSNQFHVSSHVSLLTWISIDLIIVRIVGYNRCLDILP